MRSWTSVGRGASFSPGVIVLAVFLAVGFLGFEGDGAAQAAPVTFAFDSNITDIEGDVASLGLPFSLQVGIKIHGKYQFSSEQDLIDVLFNPQAGRAGVFLLNVTGFSLEATTNFGLIDSSGIIDGPPGPHTSLFLTYKSATNAFPGWGGNLAGTPWNSSLSLFGPEEIALSTEAVVSTDVWNQLNVMRRLDLQFGYFEGSEFRMVTVEASVGEFTTVPEPHFLFLLGVAITSRFVLLKYI